MSVEFSNPARHLAHTPRSRKASDRKSSVSHPISAPHNARDFGPRLVRWNPSDPSTRMCKIRPATGLDAIDWQNDKRVCAAAHKHRGQFTGTRTDATHACRGRAPQSAPRSSTKCATGENLCVRAANIPADPNRS